MIGPSSHNSNTAYLLLLGGWMLASLLKVTLWHVPGHPWLHTSLPQLRILLRIHVPDHGHATIHHLVLHQAGLSRLHNPLLLDIKYILVIGVLCHYTEISVIARA